MIFTRFLNLFQFRKMPNRDHKKGKKGKKGKKSQKQNRIGRIKIIKDPQAKKAFKDALEEHTLNGINSLHDEYVRKFVKCDGFHIKKQLNNQTIGRMVMEETDNEIYVLLLYINQQFRRNAYGTEVVEWLKKKGKIIKINCDEEDLQALDFWLLNGFQRNETGDIEGDAGFVFDPTS